MIGTQRRRRLVASLAFAAVLGGAQAAGGLPLGTENLNLRARAYMEGAVRLNDSQSGTTPRTFRGQLVEQRNFLNPELDANLTPYTGPSLRGTFLDWLAPDDLRLRVAGWWFYDGIYDYGTSQFNDLRLAPSVGNVIPPPRGPGRALYLEGRHLAAIDPATGLLPAGPLDTVFPGYDDRDARDVYSERGRVNELYLSYSKGPLFVRFGKQSISWGEADTIALLDQNNPFDVTMGAPGIFQDLDEARIPLWTLRTAVNLPDFRVLSNNSLEAYWVPGSLDTNTGLMPMLTASPYSPAGPDPQLQFPCGTRNGQPDPRAICNQQQMVLFDHQPAHNLGNSRWGVRGQTVIDRTYTFSAWYYTHFPNAPVPRRAGRSEGSFDDNVFPLIVTETVHKLTSVTGLSNSFFFDPLSGIVRMEAEYFDNEPAFIPEVNLGQLDKYDSVGRVPRADFLRWELGYDRFFFVRWLNPTNSFTLVTSLVGSWNLSETSVQDFRANGQLKQSFFAKPQGTTPTEDDFVQLKQVEGFLQTTLQSDYLHGRLTPRLTSIFHSRGTYLLRPQIDYRWTDNVLLGASYVHIGGEFQSFGFFRDRDQIAMRMTLQLN